MKESLICVAEHVECQGRDALGELLVGALGSCWVAGMELAMGAATGWFEPCSAQPGPLAGDGAAPWWSLQAPSPPALITP